MITYISKSFLAVGDNNYIPGQVLNESPELCEEFLVKGQAEKIEEKQVEKKVKKQKDVSEE